MDVCVCVCVCVCQPPVTAAQWSLLRQSQRSVARLGQESRGGGRLVAV